MKVVMLAIILLFNLSVEAKNPNPFHGVPYANGVKIYNSAECTLTRKVKKCTTANCKKTELLKLKLFFMYFNKTYGMSPPESSESCN